MAFVLLGLAPGRGVVEFTRVVTHVQGLYNTYQPLQESYLLLSYIHTALHTCFIIVGRGALLKAYKSIQKHTAV